MSYSISLSELLESAGAAEGCRLSVSSRGKTYTGTLMPHHDFSGGDVVVIKLDSGYNIGVRVDGDSEVEVLERPRPPKARAPSERPRGGLPRITVIGTGGTISSNADTRTGALCPAFPLSELVDAAPEVRGSADVTERALFSVFSENMGVPHWQMLAEAVAEELNGGADAVVVLHGTDTMGYTAAALSFMLQGVPRPVVLVGAQRSPDRPASDAPSNLTAAVRFCLKGGAAGVFVVMHDTLGDDSFAVHAGTRVRKMHTSRRDAFRSVNAPPVAFLDEAGAIRPTRAGRPPSAGETVAATGMEGSVALLQYYPGMDPSLFEGVIMKSKGVVIAGTGLGHVGEGMIPLIKRACDNGTVVVVTSQCIGGRTNLNVYSTGRDMISAGATAVLDMLPETAYVKLMWALANSEDAEGARRLMRTPLADEMGDRREVDV